MPGKENLNRKKITVIVAFCSLFFVVQSRSMAGKRGFSYEFDGYSFQSLFELPVREEIGPDKQRGVVVEFSVSKSSDPAETAGFRLVLFKIPGNKTMGPLSQTSSLADKLNYCSSVYLGMSPGSLNRVRQFKGHAIQGFSTPSSIPVKGFKEGYIVKMEDGKEIFVGIFYPGSTARQDMDNQIQTILDSLHIISPERGLIQFIRRFKTDYVVSEKTIGASDLAGQELRVDGSGLQSIDYFRFKSRKTISGKKGYYLRFRLSVFHYDELNHAKQAFAGFVAAQRSDGLMMVSKAPMLAFCKNHCLYILDSSCQFSHANLDKIENQLITAIYPAGNPQKRDYIKRHCGGRLD